MALTRLCAFLIAAGLALSACGSAPEPPKPPGPTDASTTPSRPGEWFTQLRTGVVRLQSVTCDGVATGSGFLIAPNLVATVAHVVDGATSLSVRGDGGVVTGTVIGIDVKREVALIRLEPTGNGDRYAGQTLEFSTANTPPAVNSPVHVLGYPKGRQLSMTSGTVNSLEARIDIGMDALEGLIQYDAIATGGNSGGPLINDQGQVIGLIEAGAVQEGRDSEGEPVYVEQTGIGYAVPANVASRLTSAWQASPMKVNSDTCSIDLRNQVEQASVHPEAPVLASTFARYFEGINSGDYEQSWRLLGAPARQHYSDLTAFMNHYATTEVSEIVLEKVNLVDPLTDTAVVSYRSESADGVPCTESRLQYTLRLDSGFWTIDDESLLGPARPCAVPSTSTPAPSPTATATATAD